MKKIYLLFSFLFLSLLACGDGPVPPTASIDQQPELADVMLYQVHDLHAKKLIYEDSSLNEFMGEKVLEKSNVQIYPGNYSAPPQNYNLVRLYVKVENEFEAGTNRIVSVSFMNAVNQWFTLDRHNQPDLLDSSYVLYSFIINDNLFTDSEHLENMNLVVAGDGSGQYDPLKIKELKAYVYYPTMYRSTYTDLLVDDDITTGCQMPDCRNWQEVTNPSGLPNGDYLYNIFPLIPDSKS